MNSLLRVNCASLMRGPSCAHIRRITTEQKRNAASTPGTSSVGSTVDQSETAMGKSKNWVSYGWSHDDKKEDRARMKSSFFLSITFGMVVFGTVLAYEPDRNMRNWAQREGFLRLRERELAGLEPIDPDYIDPSTLALPSEEELGNIELIV